MLSETLFALFYHGISNMSRVRRPLQLSNVYLTQTFGKQLVVKNAPNAPYSWPSMSLIGVVPFELELFSAHGYSSTFIFSPLSLILRQMLHRACLCPSCIMRWWPRYIMHI